MRRAPFYAMQESKVGSKYGSTTTPMSSNVGIMHCLEPRAHLVSPALPVKSCAIQPLDLPPASSLIHPPAGSNQEPLPSVDELLNPRSIINTSQELTARSDDGKHVVITTFFCHWFTLRLLISDNINSY